ncbi:hypothetical protein [Roseimaritima ulvae]|uniref:Uncharacterized protein n=1 Tax=Roseimaritima ulvae TaxID=980254 RepID=A0A5B9QVF4_9BACT|nr:hypothetical protein [Roseimaritima ulvae]QEG41879.1 hypothetical protein UC8_39070 [Roseimaritima ulvae]
MSASTSSRSDSRQSNSPEQSSSGSQSTGEITQDYAQHYVADPARDVFALLRDYANEKPDVAAMWCFGLGVLVGWKLRR